MEISVLEERREEGEIEWKCVVEKKEEKKLNDGLADWENRISMSLW
jgi:hypothetical protein